MHIVKLSFKNVQVDWHGFVVVETVDYQPWEVGNFPPPTNPTEVGARVLIQRRAETSIPVKSKTDKDKEDGERSGANLQVDLNSSKKRTALTLLLIFIVS